ncbi:hypothetical protein STCU_00494 [Strigomonas culicis]|uniref:Vesicle transport protein n=1 Tax=Strigomonas culicis TaxID=28005 RepID=S9W2C9_9TRYP|nr:hypothetical protein STCU_04291 [Strigomonas culicis]EPY36612.1 hypothetical protein STCU_00494 [Strigomonas culicis]|eukprot:EPY29990.1 hypothetical protein STCU_04291 [Strigomonas culicis]
MDKFTTIINIGDIKSGGSSDNESLCPSMSFKHRIMGCAGCMAIGMLFSLLSIIAMFFAEYVFFGVLFTLGNLCSIGGTLFLAGPVKQFKNMFNESRWIASVLYLSSMLATILVAVLLQSGIGVLCCCLVQYGAMWWYFLSYVPFARDCIKSAVKGVFSK